MLIARSRPQCTRPELLAILQTMLRISTTFGAVDEPGDVGFQSDIINRAVAALPDIKDDVAHYLDMFNHQAAAKDDKYLFFRDEGENDEYEKIVEHKLVPYPTYLPWPEKRNRRGGKEIGGGIGRESGREGMLIADRIGHFRRGSGARGPQKGHFQAAQGAKDQLHHRVGDRVSGGVAQRQGHAAKCARQLGQDQWARSPSAVQ